MKRLISICLLLQLPILLFSQTAKWATLPTYDAIEDYVDNYLKVYKGTLMGVATLDGKEIVPAQYDHITSFVDGYALALNKIPDSKEWRISAIIQRDGMKHTVLKENYYNTKYSYSSNGKILVKSEKGLFGYLGNDGSLAIPCKYTKAYPFSEGLASVVEKKLHFYITLEGELAFRPSGRMYREAFSFHDGCAVVYVDGNTKIEGYIINKRGQEVRSHAMDFSDAMELAKKSRDWSLNTEPVEENIGEVLPLSKDGVIPFSENENWGYKKDENIVLLPQFEQAEPFAGGYAKVKKDGKWGVLKLYDGNFSASQSKDVLEVRNRNVGSLQYSLSLPDAWKGVEAMLVCEDGEHSETLFEAAVETNPLVLDVPLKLQGMEKQKQLHFIFSADNLLLWHDVRDVSFTYKLNLTKPVSLQEKADEEDNMVVLVTIENPYAEAVTTDVTVRVDGHNEYDPKRSRVTINANSKKDVYVTLKNVTEEKNVDITVSLSEDMGTVKGKEILLKPFY